MLRRIHPPSLYIAFLDITELHALPIEVGPSQHGPPEMAALSPISTTPTPPINDDSKTTRSLVDAVKKTGLTTLCTPQHDTTTADVIFVHGLQGDPQNTWRYKTGREPAKRGLFHGLGKKKAKPGKSRSTETMF
jgi:hypothetical protein